MKRTHFILACAVALAFSSLANLHAAEEGRKEGKATVRSVHGTVEYLDKDTWLPVKPNMKFAAGITIRTGADGIADISVNGTSSAVRLTNATMLKIPTMSYVGTVREGDTTTMLDLESGSVLGNVKKISANSRYEIMTPHGVAGIRGTDFKVEAIPTQDGKFLVTFNSITGVITVSAVINGVTVTHTLTTGTSWEIGETPKQMKAEVTAEYQSQIMGLVQSVENSINNGNNGAPGTRGGTGIGTGTGTGTPTTPPPFSAGPPTGAPAS